MASFTPFASTLGGVLVGLAATVLLLFNGRIAGISGIFAQSLSGWTGQRGYRLAFLGGLVGGGVFLRLAYPAAFDGVGAVSLSTAAIAGLLVGFGTRLGNGCTSGHGVCGIARLSPRSIAATAVFMATGVLTVAVARHWIGA